MFFTSTKKKFEKYFEKNPDIKTIVIVGSYGRKSAIRALGITLGQALTVTVGVNTTVHEDVAILDYKSMEAFPDINPDIVVVTSCRTDEEARTFFDIANKAEYVIVNFNDVPQQFAKYLKNPNVITYGDEYPADYYFENHDFSLDGYEGDIVNTDREHIPVKLTVLGEHHIRPILMAAAIAKLFQIPREKIITGLQSITPLHGRMSPATGAFKNVTIIDDSSYIGAESIRQGVNTIAQLQSSSKILIIDDDMKVRDIDLQMITDVLVLGMNPSGQVGPKFHYFEDELSLMEYLGGREEEDGIILLEIALPEIIQSYKWA